MSENKKRILSIAASVVFNLNTSLAALDVPFTHCRLKTNYAK